MDVISSPGRYVVAPPSRHTSGGSYGWITDRPVAVLPGWLIEDTTASSEPRALRRPRGRDCPGLIRTVLDAPEGTRNNALYWAASNACRDGNDHVVPDLAAAAAANGLDPAEIRRTIESAERGAGMVLL